MDSQQHAPETGPLVGIVMGSDSDWPVMREAADALESFGVAVEVGVVSLNSNARYWMSTRPVRARESAALAIGSMCNPGALSSWASFSRKV